MRQRASLLERLERIEAMLPKGAPAAATILTFSDSDRDRQIEDLRLRGVHCSLKAKEGQPGWVQEIRLVGLDGEPYCGGRPKEYEG